MNYKIGSRKFLSYRPALPFVGQVARGGRFYACKYSRFLPFENQLSLEIDPPVSLGRNTSGTTLSVVNASFAPSSSLMIVDFAG